MEKNKSGLRSVTSHADIIDFYPITPEYKLRGRSRYTSWLGVLLSLSLIVLLLVVLILDIVDLADRDDPKIVISRLSKATINDKMIVFIPNATFQMSWNIFSLTYDTSPNDVYVIKCVIRYIDPVTGDTMSQDFIVGTCDEKNFPYATPPSIFYTRPGELLCFSQNQSFDISEIYLQTGVREVLIQYYTGYDAGLDTKQVFPEDNDFSLYYLSWAVDPSNYTTPLSASYQGTSFGLVKDIQKSYQISLVTVDFVSDDGWLFESSSTQTVINIEKIDQDMATLDNKTFDLSVGIQGRPFLTITIVNGGNKIVYNRQYQKVFDIFGDITGYYAIILPIVGLIILPYLPYARLKMYEDTANEIYEFRRKKTEKEQKKQRKQKKKAYGRKPDDVVAGATTTQKQTYKRRLSRSVNPEIQNSPQNPNADHLNISEPQLMAVPYQSPTQVISSAPQPKHKSGPIHITFFGWLKSKIRPKRKVKLLSQAVKEIEETMDMTMIMKRLRDMQNLKEFWLTEEQRILFEGLEKPMLEVRTDSQFQDRFRKSINWRSSYEGNNKTPEEAYESINGKEFLSDIDKQLLFYFKKDSHEL